jgi:hypothetical protein
MAIESGIRSSSLIEVLVSMILISLSICLASMIFTQVSASRSQHRKVEAIIRINSIINNASVEELKTDEDFLFDNMTISREMTKSGDKTIYSYTSLCNDSLKVYSQNHIH